MSQSQARRKEILVFFPLPSRVKLTTPVPSGPGKELIMVSIIYSHPLWVVPSLITLPSPGFYIRQQHYEIYSRLAGEFECFSAYLIHTKQDPRSKP